MNEAKRELVVESPGPCPACKGSGRIWGSLSRPGAPMLTVEAVPCPRCRPEASPLTPDLKAKDGPGQLAAKVAQARGL